MNTRDEYVAKVKLQLDEMNTRMSELEVRAKQSRDDVEDNYDELMTHLREQSQAATAKLEELKSAGESGWGTMVAETEKIHAAFAHAFSKFRS